MKRLQNQTYLITASILCTTICSSLTACGLPFSISRDTEFFKQMQSSMTEAQTLLDDIISISDEMATESFIIEDGGDIDDYVELCRTNLDTLTTKADNLRSLQQTVQQFDAPKSEEGKAISEVQEDYFNDILMYAESMSDTLTFYIAQYDESIPLIDAISQDIDDYQQYLYDVYQAALQTKDSFLALSTPNYLSDIWPLYTNSLDMLTKYLQSLSYAEYGDVLRYYSANQIINRMSIVTGSYEVTIDDLIAQEYVHCGDVLERSLKGLGEDILAACAGTSLPEDNYATQNPIVYSHYSMADEIYPNLYPATDSVANLVLYTDKGYGDVTVTAEIPGFTQVYEQKVKLSPDLTYLMVKPPVLADMPDLSAAKDTQLTLKVTDNITGEVYIQESKPLKLYSIYDYRSYSDEFGIIQNDNILAWMTPESDGVLAVRRNAITWLENVLGPDYGILPGYQYAYGFGQGEEANVTYYEVAAIQSTISAMGVRYNMGPYSLNATQRVLMPDAVLESQSGICIETAVLMASVLQSADMHPMIVFTPGHAQVAVETWSNSGEYFLIETTCLPFDASTENVSNVITYLDSNGWADYLSAKQQVAEQSGGMVYIVDCDLAKELNIKGLAY